MPAGQLASSGERRVHDRMQSWTTGVTGQTVRVLLNVHRRGLTVREQQSSQGKILSSGQASETSQLTTARRS